MNNKKYFDKNKALWNERTPIHVKSRDYDVDGFRQGKSSLNSTELKLLPDLRGKKVLHLQCHFGLDSLSLARMGARVTGVDFSESAIEMAKKLAAEQKLDARFICCNIYDLSQHLDEKFDIIFTSYGVLCWLPDLSAWGKLINHYLKPDGMFFMVEFHPAFMMFDFDSGEITHSYFKTQEPIIEENATTYTDITVEKPVIGNEYNWNHALDEVITVLLDAGLTICHFKEYPFSHYNCFPNMEQQEDDKWCFREFESILPLIYSISAKKIMC